MQPELFSLFTELFKFANFQLQLYLMYLTFKMLFIFSVLICKSFSHSSIPYSDQLSRNKLIYAAISAYASPPQSCMSLAFQNFQVKPQITVACDTLDDTCSGFTGVDHESQAILVAFRGTNRNAQLLVEAVETVFANNVS